MKVLMLGGTGAMGSNLADIMSTDDFEVYITTRAKRKNYGNVTYLIGNAKDSAFLSSILESEYWDVIIDFMVYNTPEFARRASLLLQSTRKYFFISSSRVYADTHKDINEKSDRLIDVCDDDKFVTSSQYPITKSEQENILFETNASNWCIIRPYITYHTHRLQLGVFEKEEWLYRVLQGKALVFPKQLLVKKTTMTSGIDVAKIIKELVLSQNTEREIYNVTSEYSLTWGEVIDIYFNEIESITNKKPRVFYQDCDDFYKYNSEYPMLYDRLYDRTFTNEKLKKTIPNIRFLEPDYGLKTSLRNFMANKSFNKINWKAEAYKDKATGDLHNIFSIKTFKDKCKYLIFRFI
ncbi:NAD-dependent epimerase/dehydratase family protein [Vibrio mediterranei]|uniref:NAD-dependent epimerase/dehydratase family protein n=1 Tax=Vibrio mediterranei TaxID=689 RepID=UPI004068A235